MNIRASLKRDPSGPGREREGNRRANVSEVERLEILFAKIVPYVRSIRPRIADMIDQTNLVACYFLFGKIAQSVRGIFLLAKEGFHYEVMELVRSNREALDLVALLLRERPDSPLLQKWFDGEIVENEKARKAMAALMDEFGKASGTELPVSEMKSGIYSGLSKYTHVSYAALLDSYDVYNDDFDFERNAGHHYVRNSSLPYLEGELHALVIGLKQFCQMAGDVESYGGLDAILREHAPHMHEGAGMKESMDELRRKFPGLG